MELVQERFLEDFDKEHVGASKGALSMIVTINRKMQTMDFPVDPSDLQTDKRGQIAGLGGGAIRKILSDHGISRVLSSEGGRTSRGNMERMVAYVEGTNRLHGAGALDLGAAEEFWIARVTRYFDSQPFVFRLDPTLSLKVSIRRLLEQARDRQREATGTMYVGAVMQHLVGAKLETISSTPIERHGFAVADGPTNRQGDFLLGDVVLHITTAPSEALIGKCKANLSIGLRPLIITTEDGMGGARALARNQNIEDRIDVIEFEQFLAANVHEHGKFTQQGRRDMIRRLMERYNSIISECETDPSLRIEYDG